MDVPKQGRPVQTTGNIYQRLLGNCTGCLSFPQRTIKTDISDLAAAQETDAAIDDVDGTQEEPFDYNSLPSYAKWDEFDARIDGDGDDIPRSEWNFWREEDGVEKKVRKRRLELFLGRHNMIEEPANMEQKILTLLRGPCRRVTLLDISFAFLGHDLRPEAQQIYNVMANIFSTCLVHCREIDSIAVSNIDLLPMDALRSLMTLLTQATIKRLSLSWDKVDAPKTFSELTAALKHPSLSLRALTLTAAVTPEPQPGNGLRRILQALGTRRDGKVKSLCLGGFYLGPREITLLARNSDLRRLKLHTCGYPPSANLGGNAKSRVRSLFKRLQCFTLINLGKREVFGRLSEVLQRCISDTLQSEGNALERLAWEEHVYRLGSAICPGLHSPNNHLRCINFGGVFADNDVFKAIIERMQTEGNAIEELALHTNSYDPLPILDTLRLYPYNKLKRLSLDADPPGDVSLMVCESLRSPYNKLEELSLYFPSRSRNRPSIPMKVVLAAFQSNLTLFEWEQPGNDALRFVRNEKWVQVALTLSSIVHIPKLGRDATCRMLPITDLLYGIAETLGWRFSAEFMELLKE